MAGSYLPGDNDPVVVNQVAVQPYREEFYKAAFNVESLDAMFDVTPGAEAAALFRAAVDRINADPARFVGLRGEGEFLSWRMLRDQIHGFALFLEQFEDSTITGAFEDGNP